MDRRQKSRDKDQNLTPAGPLSVEQAMRAAIENKKRSGDPNYKGGNPGNADEALKDLQNMGVVKKELTPEEKKAIKKTRDQITVEAKTAGHGGWVTHEKEGKKFRQWEFDERFQEKAGEEMLGATRNKRITEADVEAQKAEEALRKTELARRVAEGVAETERVRVMDIEGQKQNLFNLYVQHIAHAKSGAAMPSPYSKNVKESLNQLKKDLKAGGLNKDAIREQISLIELSASAEADRLKQEEERKKKELAEAGTSPAPAANPIETGARLESRVKAGGEKEPAPFWIKKFEQANPELWRKLLDNYKKRFQALEEAKELDITKRGGFKIKGGFKMDPAVAQETIELEDRVYRYFVDLGQIEDEKEAKEKKLLSVGNSTRKIRQYVKVLAGFPEEIAAGRSFANIKSEIERELEKQLPILRKKESDRSPEEVRIEAETSRKLKSLVDELIDFYKSAGHSEDEATDLVLGEKNGIERKIRQEVAKELRWGSPPIARKSAPGLGPEPVPPIELFPDEGEASRVSAEGGEPLIGKDEEYAARREDLLAPEHTSMEIEDVEDLEEEFREDVASYEESRLEGVPEEELGELKKIIVESARSLQDALMIDYFKNQPEEEARRSARAIISQIRQEGIDEGKRRVASAEAAARAPAPKPGSTIEFRQIPPGIVKFARDQFEPAYRKLLEWREKNKEKPPTDQTTQELREYLALNNEYISQRRQLTNLCTAFEEKFLPKEEKKEAGNLAMELVIAIEKRIEQEIRAEKETGVPFDRVESPEEIFQKEFSAAKLKYAEIMAQKYRGEDPTLSEEDIKTLTAADVIAERRDIEALVRRKLDKK